MTRERHPEVSKQLYSLRLRRGWSARRAATIPPIRDKSPQIIVDGVQTTVARARNVSGVGVNLYHRRVSIGWSQARAAATPPGRKGRPDATTERFYEFCGKRMSLFLWARELKLKYRTLRARMNKGLTFEQAVNHKHRARFPD